MIAQSACGGTRKRKCSIPLNVFWRTFRNLISVEAATPASTARIYSNDQYVEAYNDALGVDDNHPVGCGGPGPFASPNRCATQRHPGSMPCGLRSPLRQYSAGRQGLAAMPAAEYVESLVGLSGRGARSRNTGSPQSR